MVTPEERQFMWEFYAPAPRMRLNLGIRRRLAPLLGGSRPRIELANSLLLTLAGSPVIYYGDEIGMGDNIELEDRDGVRTPMQWSLDANAGFSQAPPDALYNPVIDDETYGYRQVNVTAQRCDAGSLFTRMREMLAVRKAHPAFGRGDLHLLVPDDPAVLAYLRTWEDETLLVANNLSSEPREAVLTLPVLPVAHGPGASLDGREPVDLFTGQALPPIAGPLRLSLEPYGYRWLALA
jgi:maltose alpha-D-glucosyltransferase/alpha-amylase